MNNEKQGAKSITMSKVKSIDDVKRILIKNIDSLYKSHKEVIDKIIAERLIAYKYGRISEVQVQNIEKNLTNIIQQFEEMKKDLVFLLGENEDQQS